MENINLQRRNNFKLDLLSLAIVFFILGFFYLASLSMLSAKNHEVEYMKRDISSIVTSNERLELEIGYNESLDKVENAVEGQQAMVEPDEGAIYLIQLDKGNMLAAAKEPSEAEGDLKNASGDNKFLAESSIAGILSRWTI